MSAISAPTWQIQHVSKWRKLMDQCNLYQLPVLFVRINYDFTLRMLLNYSFLCIYVIVINLNPCSFVKSYKMGNLLQITMRKFQIIECFANTTLSISFQFSFIGELNKLIIQYILNIRQSRVFSPLIATNVSHCLEITSIACI